MKQLCFFLVLCLFSCKRPEDRACLKSTGKEAAVEHILSSFDAVTLGPKLSFELIQDSVNFIKITGGKNVLKFVDFSVNHGHLSIENTNKCMYLRSPKKKIRIELHYKGLDTLLLRNTEPVRMLNAKIGDHLYIYFIESSSSLNAHVEVKNLTAETQDTWADMTIKGSTSRAKFWLKGNAVLHAEELEIKDYVNAKNWSVGHLYLGNLTDTLSAEIKNRGNIYYYGKPSYLEFFKNGSGNLIQN